MKYFTLEECYRSSTAAAKGIDNTPTPEIEAHIVESIETLIDPLREAWEAHCRQNGLGKVGINISSGYRGPALNKAVGGSFTSAHCHGYAFDLVPVNRQMRAFKRFCRGRGRPRRTQLDARGLQTSRRQAAAQTVLLDDTRKILSHDGLTL